MHAQFQDNNRQYIRERLTTCTCYIHSHNILLIKVPRGVFYVCTNIYMYNYKSCPNFVKVFMRLINGWAHMGPFFKVGLLLRYAYS